MANESQDSTEDSSCSVCFQAFVEVMTPSVPTEERSEGRREGGITDKGDIFRPVEDDVILPPHLQ